MNEPIYELTNHFRDDYSGRYASRNIAFSSSVDALKAKACEDKRVFDQLWIEKDNYIELEVEDEYYQDTYIITKIELI